MPLTIKLWRFSHMGTLSFICMIGDQRYTGLLQHDLTGLGPLIEEKNRREDSEVIV